MWQCGEVNETSTNQSHKALWRITLIAQNYVHFCPISEPNHLKYHKIKVGILLPGAPIWGEPVTEQRKWRAREKCKNKRDRAERNKMQ